MNLPGLIYKYTDFCLIPFLNNLIPREIVSTRLKKEQEHFSHGDLEHALILLGTIHERASSMVGHLSLMLALCLFMLQSDTLATEYLVEKIIVAVDAIVYIFLVLLTVRCLKSIGLDKDYETKESYLKHIEEELVTKYSIMHLVNSMTLLATVVLVFALLYHLF